MKPYPALTTTREDRAVFGEALLAAHVGDPDSTRDIRPLRRLTRDRSPFTWDHMERAWALLMVIHDAVATDLDYFGQRAVATAPPTSDERMAHVIAETRARMLLAVEDAIEIVEEGLAMLPGPEVMDEMVGV